MTAQAQSRNWEAGGVDRAPPGTGKQRIRASRSLSLGLAQEGTERTSGETSNTKTPCKAGLVDPDSMGDSSKVEAPAQ